MVWASRRVSSPLVLTPSRFHILPADYECLLVEQGFAIPTAHNALLCTVATAASPRSRASPRLAPVQVDRSSPPAAAPGTSRPDGVRPGCRRGRLAAWRPPMCRGLIPG